MHSYLRAIGFSKIEHRCDLEKLFDVVIASPTEKYMHKVNDTENFVEISKEVCERIGITIRGIYDEKGFFHLEHYFPYVKGRNVSVKDRLTITKKVDSRAQSCMCDDIRLGVSLIFYLQNTIDYIKTCESGKYVLNRAYSVKLSGLSVDGMILLPVKKSEKYIEHRKKERKKRNHLIAEARQGNQEAIDSLTIEDIDTFAMVSRRTKREDIYSIVDTSFFPYGSESDNYSIVGTILEIKMLINEITGETVYNLLVECNELLIDICINKNNLFGMPFIGARFKGSIWLQGAVDFYEN